jgi:hypothetical protein
MLLVVVVVAVDIVVVIAVVVDVVVIVVVGGNVDVVVVHAGPHPHAEAYRSVDVPQALTARLGNGSPGLGVSCAQKADAVDKASGDSQGNKAR